MDSIMNGKPRGRPKSEKSPRSTPPQSTSTQGNIKLSIFTIVAISREYYVDGMSTKDLSSKYKLCYDRLKRLLKHFGTTSNKPLSRFPNEESISQADAMYEMFQRNRQTLTEQDEIQDNIFALNIVELRIKAGKRPQVQLASSWG